jgi:hypothetical protein
MKNSLLIAVILICCLTESRSQTIVKDTIYYNNLKYFPGRQVQIFFGSGENGEFVYAFIGGRSRIIKDFRKSDLYPLSEHFAKVKILIDRVYSIGDKYYARGALMDHTGKGFDDHYVYIEVKGAVDNREVWEDSLK